MITASERTVNKMNRKVLSISSKRQITIPQKFYQRQNVLCVVAS
jgi:hypothetical protein